MHVCVLGYGCGCEPLCVHAISLYTNFYLRVCMHTRGATRAEVLLHSLHSDF